MQISRRSFLFSSSMAATAAVFVPRILFAQTPEAQPLPAFLVQFRKAGETAKIDIQPQRGNVSVLMGSGGNIAVLPGKDGKLLVDSGMSTSKPQITDALGKISGDPMTHLVNTHWHFDHTDGNEWMHSAGAVIIAHENTKKHMAVATYMGAAGGTFPPSPAGALPTKTFTDAHKLTINGETVHLEHFAPAHTDSDILAHFENANVLHMGDTWFHGAYPLIDLDTGGRIDGMVDAATKGIKIADAKTIIIPGHGAVGDKAGLTEYRDMLAEIRTNVAALKKQGKSLDEAKAARPTAKYDAKFGGGFINGDTFTTFVYNSL